MSFHELAQIAERNGTQFLVSEFFERGWRCDITFPLAPGHVGVFVFGRAYEAGDVQLVSRKVGCGVEEIEQIGPAQNMLPRFRSVFPRQVGG
jgi:hypothetical protein